VWLEGLGQLKNPMTSSGRESMTFRLLAECLNQLRYHVIWYYFSNESGLFTVRWKLRIKKALLYKVCCSPFFWGLFRTLSIFRPKMLQFNKTWLSTGTWIRPLLWSFRLVMCVSSRNGIEYFEIRFYLKSSAYYTSDDRKHGKKVFAVCRHVAISSLCEALWTYI
jgi:hypothetical protein